MSCAKTAALVLFALGTPVTALAVEPQAGTPAAPNPSAKAAHRQEERASEPARANPAAAKPGPHKPEPVRRRSVQQVIATVPPPALANPSYAPTLTNPSYAPTLAPRAPGPPAPGSGLPPALPPPAQLSRCAGNACTDASGNTYNTGVGNAAVNGQGRLCNRVGNTMQCF